MNMMFSLGANHNLWTLVLVNGDRKFINVHTDGHLAMGHVLGHVDGLALPEETTVDPQGSGYPTCAGNDARLGQTEVSMGWAEWVQCASRGGAVCHHWNPISGSYLLPQILHHAKCHRHLHSPQFSKQP